MSERRLLAVLALLIGLLAALLLLIGLRLPGGNEPFLDWLARIALAGILGLIAIATSFLIYGGQYKTGGILNVVMGLVVVIIGAGMAAGLLLVLSGILGLVAAGTFPQYAPR